MYVNSILEGTADGGLQIILLRCAEISAVVTKKVIGRSKCFGFVYLDDAYDSVKATNGLD